MKINLFKSKTDQRIDALRSTLEVFDTEAEWAMSFAKKAEDVSTELRRLREAFATNPTDQTAEALLEAETEFAAKDVHRRNLSVGAGKHIREKHLPALQAALKAAFQAVQDRLIDERDRIAVHDKTRAEELGLSEDDVTSPIRGRINAEIETVKSKIEGVDTWDISKVKANAKEILSR